MTSGPFYAAHLRDVNGISFIGSNFIIFGKNMVFTMPPPGSQANLLTVVNGKDANGPCVCCCIYKCGRTHAVHVSMVQWFFPKINKWSWRTRIIHSFSGIANRFQRIIAKGQSTPWYVPIFFFVLLIPWIQWYLKKFHIETRSVTALKFLRCPSIIFARNLGLNR